MSESIAYLYRRQALEAHGADSAGAGVLRITPPWSWAVLATASVMFVTAFAFAWFGRVEVVTRGRAVLRPASGLRVVRAQATGTAAEVLVRSGQRVEAGDQILGLEVPQTEAAVIEADRALTFVAESSLLREQTSFAQQRQALSGRRQQLLDQIASLERSKQRAERIYEANAKLAKDGLISDLSLETYRDARETLYRQLSTARAGLLQVNQELAETELQKASWERQHEQAISAARAKREALQVPQRSSIVTAPVRGHIESITVRAGDLIQAGQEIGKIIPVDSRLIVIAFLAEKDRGFVHPGDVERLEFDRYPYAEFGTLKGRVLNVSDEIASPYELAEAFGEDARTMTRTCRVELELIGPARRNDIQLTSGMIMSVRFVLRKERPLMLLWSPVRQLVD
jgi:membrane fusion protein